MNKGRILIVEDELILAEDLAISLENAGYTVVGSVSSGDQAIKTALEA
jgi:DNA-binding response OmpR family regulator